MGQRNHGIRFGPIPTPLFERFSRKGWDYTPEGCWEWRGQRNEHGYGLLSERRTRQYVRVHQIAWEYFNGESIPEGLVVRHACDNPPCVNPWHMLLGTMAQNSQDMKDRRRHWLHDAARCKNGHDITTPGSVKVERIKGQQRNRCVKCAQACSARYEAKVKAARRKRMAERLIA